MAKTFAERYLTPQDDITVNLTNIYERAKREIDIQINKGREKDARVEIQRTKQRAISASSKGNYSKNHTYGKNNKPNISRARQNTKAAGLIGIQSYGGDMGLKQ